MRRSVLVACLLALVLSLAGLFGCSAGQRLSDAGAATDGGSPTDGGAADDGGGAGTDDGGPAADGGDAAVDGGTPDGGLGDRCSAAKPGPLPSTAAARVPKAGDGGPMDGGLGLGEPCTGDLQCASTFCVLTGADGGVCCDQRACGGCATCTGQDGGPGGTCTALPAGTALPGCASCDGVGGCATVEGCTKDLDCITGYFCKDTVCNPVRAPGAECTRRGECASCACDGGHCQ